ncbi:MAG: ABC transporter ATP-binding protein [Spirochaetes bacterium]|nr:ABC transporter ATP-binding protein [Spirochaetota bacterium]
MGAGRLSVLKNIDLKINQSEICSIVGPSGAGKSTLLNCIGCLDSFNSGSLKIHGKELSNMTIEDLSGFRNKKLGFIFQMHNLLPEFSALENVMMPMLISRVSGKSARLRAREIIAEFGLSERINHKPGELSGGECQRIAVARAIVNQPSIILADEPTGSLDSENSSNLIDILFRLGKQMNTTIIIVTHDKTIAEKTERIISLKDGKIIEDSAVIG